jgi:hypothetical protein
MKIAAATVEETGVPVDQLEQLIVKTLYGGELTGLGIADRVRLPYPVLEPVIERIRTERLVEVRGATGSGSGAYRYILTDLGRLRARQYLDANGYVGAAPVPLAEYVAYMQKLGTVRGHIDVQRLRGAFSHLVVGDRVLDHLGPALNSNRAVFLYGPPGNGKTVIAEGMGAALGGDMYVPYAIDVDGSTIRVFDPAIHEVVEETTRYPGSTLVSSASHDRRWARVHRPVVVVGGELTLEMLDLTFSRITRFYEAPIQLKTNGGVFLVDDFGRQRMRPEELLNRWIVPLESRVDFLTLHTGQKFEVPFESLIVFATNLDPAKLADEAFLRRIPYKIQIVDPTLAEYTRIFELNCRRLQLQFDPMFVAELYERHYRAPGRPLRACHPRDLLDHVTALCRYKAMPPTLSTELMDVVCSTYFVGRDS